MYSSSLSTDSARIQYRLTAIALRLLRDNVRQELLVPRQRNQAGNLRNSATDQWPSIVSESPLCGIFDCLQTNLLQFLVLLGRQNGFHLRIRLLVNRKSVV